MKLSGNRYLFSVVTTEKSDHTGETLKTILQRYHRLCEQLHIGSQYYKIEKSGESIDLSFRKDPYQIGKAKALFGKNIIVTDNTDWTTEDIVQASLDRWGVEKAFRDTKSKNHISTYPMLPLD